MISLFIFPYLLLSLITLGLYHLYSQKNLFQANNLFIAITALISAFLYSGQMITDVYHDVFWEKFLFIRRLYEGYFYPRIILILMGLVLPLFNFRRLFRNNLRFQYMIIGIYSSLAIIQIIHSQKTGVIPGWGWEMTILPVGMMQTLILVSGLIFIFFVKRSRHIAG